MPVESLAPYLRGARFANVAMKLRHPDCADLQEDADRYIEMLDRYWEAARATYKLHREHESSGGRAG
jgi:hypothetical protein